jgi:pyruvate formate lyase activating enzyme
LKEAMLYERGEDRQVACGLCAHRCKILPGKQGKCKVRENKNGTLYSLVYDKIISAGSDPIEKKPLYHFLPGSVSFSIATPGCNFRCDHCQNWQISQMVHDHNRISGRKFEPRQIVDQAASSGAASISYTYTEPTIFFELAYDTARLACERDIKNCFVTNGYQTPETIETIAPYLHAANVDLKSFSDETYKSLCSARLQPVLDSISNMRKVGIWIEVTTLLIPTVNDSEAELRSIAGFIAEVDPAIPWHVSAFHPDYKLTDRAATTASSIEKALEIGKSLGLRYLYAGNIRGGEWENTRCYNCGATLIERYGFNVRRNRLIAGSCPDCNTKIDGVWQ